MTTGSVPQMQTKAMQRPILEVRDLKVYFPIFGGIFYRKRGEVKAVDGVSFTLYEGEVLGLVGESGCGKSTIGKAIIQLLQATVPGVKLEGEIVFHHGDKAVALLSLTPSQMLPYRSQIQMIFQDPYSSLNPRLTVGQIIEEPLAIHCRQLSASQRTDMVAQLLNTVGLGGEQRNRYPHEFSGGQRQRIGIARALATKPRLVIADEPVSALDVSIQAQVINLMQDLQEKFGLSYVFIAHDLSVVKHISARIAVMYLGNIVEVGTSHQIYYEPVHPYTRALLSAVPMPDPKHKKFKDRTLLRGEIPSPLAKPSGCPFRTRCPIAQPDCAVKIPPLIEKKERSVACPYA
jgi:oligopeptide/dipeptide ABC transporter ATP-binding protein